MTEIERRKLTTAQNYVPGTSARRSARDEAIKIYFYAIQFLMNTINILDCVRLMGDSVNSCK